MVVASIYNCNCCGKSICNMTLILYVVLDCTIIVANVQRNVYYDLVQLPPQVNSLPPYAQGQYTAAPQSFEK
jgi:hypothetical protein